MAFRGPRPRPWTAVALALTLALSMSLAACNSGGGSPEPAPSAEGEGESESSTTTSPTVPEGAVDPCALLTREEVASATGLEVTDGRLSPGTSIIPPGASAVTAPSCEFRLAPPREREAVVVRVANKKADTIFKKIGNATLPVLSLAPTEVARNTDFEDSAAGTIPQGWEPHGVEIVTDCDAAASGKCTMRLIADDGAGAGTGAGTGTDKDGGDRAADDPFAFSGGAGAAQCVPAQEFANRTVSLSGSLRAQGLDGEGTLFLLEARAGGEFPNVATSTGVSRNSEWVRGEAVLYVSDKPTALCIGVRLNGAGVLHADGLVLSRAVNEPDGAGVEIRWQEAASTVWARKGDHALTVQLAVREAVDQPREKAAALARKVLSRLPT